MYPTPVGADGDGCPEYDVEAIIGKRVTDDLVEYLVKFIGYESPEWCVAEDIYATELILRYERDHPSGKGGKPLTCRQVVRQQNRTCQKHKAVKTVRNDTSKVSRIQPQRKVCLADDFSTVLQLVPLL